ncbi:MAG: hypothetical protein JST26_08590 [Bacteroidetes bacterium]|nr:hypothetical protein [Bacteroidota bacterium]
MKKTLSLLFILLIVANTQAQVPGYMGKRFQAGYGFYFSPALFGSTAGGKTIIGYNGNAESGTLAFNTIHEGFLEFTMKKKTIIGASVRYYKTTYDNYNDLYFFPQTSNGTYYNGNGVGHIPGFFKVTGLSYSLYFKLYFRHFTAPWGRYFIVGPTLRTMTTTYDPNSMPVQSTSYNGTTSSYYPDLGGSKQSFKSFDIIAGFGRNRVLYDKITLDYGFNINVFALMSSVLEYEGGNYASDYSASEYVRKSTRWRSRGLNRFNAFCKIGYLF